MIRELILQFKLGHVNAGYFQQKFGVEIRERGSPRPLTRHAGLGVLVEEQGDDAAPQPRRSAAGRPPRPRVLPAAAPGRAVCVTRRGSSTRWMGFTRLPDWRCRRSSRFDGSKFRRPCRQLLVHENDMTPTLEAFHAERIHLSVLARRLEGDAYARQVGT